MHQHVDKKQIIFCKIKSQSKTKSKRHISLKVRMYVLRFAYTWYGCYVIKGHHFPRWSMSGDFAHCRFDRRVGRMTSQRTLRLRLRVVVYRCGRWLLGDALTV